MGRVGWLSGLGGAALWWLGCASGPVGPPEPPLLAELGASSYQRHCAVCHGPEGRGDGPAAPALRTPPADLTRIAARRGGRFPDGEIAQTIDGRFEVAAHGTREMPIWGRRLGARQRAAIGGDAEGDARVAALIEAGYSEEVVRGQIGALVEYLRTIQR